jgi:predicted DNA-binding transcriptional regulator AlpA
MESDNSESVQSMSVAPGDLFGKVSARVKPVRPPDPDRLLNLGDVADRLNISRRTAERMRSGKQLPDADVKIGIMPRWKSETIAAWISAGGTPSSN